MHKIALVLAIAAVGEGLLALHLVRQLHEEREGAQALQARVTELERRAPQGAVGATFVAVPQSTASPFAIVNRNIPAQPQLPQPAATNAPNPQDLREQMNAAMERQRNLLSDPEYREALQTQQKMMLKQQNPDVARDLNLTPEQVDRLFAALADQSMRSMETVSMWQQQGNQASPEELQRKSLEQQSANEAELKNVLGEAKYREWMEYQTTAPARYEASRLRSLLADAGVPLDQSLAKPLQKVLLEHQKLEQQRMQQFFAKQDSANTARIGFVTDDLRSAAGLAPNTEEHMEEMQRRQREKLARVLTPEQLKVIEDEQNAQLQLQRVQTKLMRAQATAVTGDPAQNDTAVYFAPNATVEPAVDD
jgi:hypothetical protein